MNVEDAGLLCSGGKAFLCAWALFGPRAKPDTSRLSANPPTWLIVSVQAFKGRLHLVSDARTTQKSTASRFSPAGAALEALLRPPSLLLLSSFLF